MVFHRVTPGYPHNLAAALAGFESNEQIKIDPSVQLCLVSGVQANSGKLATCLSQWASHSDLENVGSCTGIGAVSV